MGFLMKEEDGERKLNIVNLIITAVISLGVIMGVGWQGRDYMDTYCTDQELNETKQELMAYDIMEHTQILDKEQADVEELRKSISGLNRQVNQNAILMRIRELEWRVADAEKMCPPDPLRSSSCSRRIKSDYESDIRELNKLRDFIKKLEEQNLLEAQ